jgi:hypothetical protein
MNTWKLIDYIDVWFNEDEGYWVNDSSVALEGITITEDASNKDIFDYLKNIVGYLGSEANYKDFTFEGDDESIEISTEKDGYTLPICRLERERNFPNEQ